MTHLGVALVVGKLRVAFAIQAPAPVLRKLLALALGLGAAAFLL